MQEIVKVFSEFIQITDSASWRWCEPWTIFIRSLTSLPPLCRATSSPSAYRSMHSKPFCSITMIPSYGLYMKKYYSFSFVKRWYVWIQVIQWHWVRDFLTSLMTRFYACTGAQRVCTTKNRPLDEQSLLFFIPGLKGWVWHHILGSDWPRDPHDWMEGTRKINSCRAVQAILLVSIDFHFNLNFFLLIRF